MHQCMCVRMCVVPSPYSVHLHLYNDNTRLPSVTIIIIPSPMNFMMRIDLGKTVYSRSFSLGVSTST